LDVGEQFIAARSASWSACSGDEAAPKEKSRKRDMAGVEKCRRECGGGMVFGGCGCVSECRSLRVNAAAGWMV
jgi:hypothetical protein